MEHKSDNTTVQSKSTDWITLSSVISACSVVLLHTNTGYWTFSATALYWKAGNLIHALFYFAVPVFFMISGATLLDYNKRYGLKTYFRKRITKTVIPYIFWSLMGVLFQVFYLKTLTRNEVTLSYVLTGLGEASLVNIYWYFIPLFSVYLSIPILAAVPEERKKTIYSYAAVTSFFLCSLLPFVIDVFDLPVSTSLTISAASDYLAYVMIGYLLRHYKTTPRLRTALYLLGIAALLVHIGGTYFASMEAGSVILTFIGYNKPTGILYSVAVFVLFRQHGNRMMKHPWVNKIICFLGKYTFSIYLLHWFLMKVIVKELSVSIFSLYYVFLAPLLIIPAAVAITYFFRKIPVLRRLLP